MKDTLQATIDAVLAMPRDTFRARFVRGFAKSARFSTVICLGAASLPAQEREQFWLDLGKEGIPLPDTTLWQEPNALEAVANTITGRMVRLS